MDKRELEQIVLDAVRMSLREVAIVRFSGATVENNTINKDAVKVENIHIHIHINEDKMGV